MAVIFGQDQDLMLETGLRIGEALNGMVSMSSLSRSEAHVWLSAGARGQEQERSSGYAANRSCIHYAQWRLDGHSSPFVFPNREGERYVSTSINHLHRNAVAPKIEGERRPLFAGDFVLHSLRHTMLTRLGESGVDAFTIMRIAGHSSIVVSQRYIHPTPEAVECAFERLQLHGTGPKIKARRLPLAIVSATLTQAVQVIEGPIAQRLEQGTHNPLVGGSNPSGPTNLASPLRRGVLTVQRGIQQTALETESLDLDDRWSNSRRLANCHSPLGE